MGERKLALITESYRQLNASLHKTVPGYGTSGQGKAKLIIEVLQDTGAATVLDYGAGKQTLKPLLSAYAKYRAYDPAVPDIDKAPKPADVVVCTDVMEHVEPQFVDGVIDDVFALAKRAVFFSISCEVGARTLDNGEPAHCSVHPAAWWLDKLAERGVLERMQGREHKDELICVVYV